jgi:hypothetical protein
MIFLPLNKHKLFNYYSLLGPAKGSTVDADCGTTEVEGEVSKQIQFLFAVMCLTPRNGRIPTRQGLSSLNGQSYKYPRRFRFQLLIK